MGADIKIIGFTDSVNECDCCGRTGLKGTYCMLIDGEERYYGSTCATKRGASAKVLKNELTAYENTVKHVNIFVRKQKIDPSLTKNMLSWALLNRGKSLKDFKI